jgi:hypothetical protein
MVSFIILTPFLCSAADTPVTGPQAILPESIYEFSSVVEGTQVIHRFVLQNRGDEPLKIFKIESG